MSGERCEWSSNDQTRGALSILPRVASGLGNGGRHLVAAAYVAKASINDGISDLTSLGPCPNYGAISAAR